MDYYSQLINIIVIAVKMVRKILWNTYLPTVYVQFLIYILDIIALLKLLNYFWWGFEMCTLGKLKWNENTVSKINWFFALDWKINT